MTAASASDEPAISAGPGIEQLRKQLASLDEALESYADPVVAEHPGLALMHRTLEERAEHIRATVAKAETATLIVTLEGAPLEHGGVPVEVLQRLLSACQQSVDAFVGEGGRDATTLRASALEIDGPRTVLRLTGPKGPLQAQPTDGRGRLLLASALARVVAGLTDPGDSEARTAVAAIAEAVEGLPVTLTVAVDAPTVDPDEAVCGAAELEALRSSA